MDVNKCGKTVTLKWTWLSSSSTKMRIGRRFGGLVTLVCLSGQCVITPKEKFMKEIILWINMTS